MSESGRTRYEREGSRVAFERVAFFVDAVYAIALTLIAVGIGVPALTDKGDAGDLWRSLGDQFSEFVSFAVGLVVIGFYWTSNHAAFDRLQAVDRRYVLWTVVYLGAVAFLPYPIRLVGSFADNPVAWSLFAINLAVVSGMETVLFAHSWRADLLAVRLSRPDYRWLTLMSLSPVPLFLLSIPVAWVSPPATLAVWALSPLVQAIAARWRPADLTE
jgi:uncharacterized membrane protein